MKQTITLEVDCDVDISGVLALYLIADACGNEASIARRYGCGEDIEYTILHALACAKVAKVSKAKPTSVFNDVGSMESIGRKQPGNDNAIRWGSSHRSTERTM